MLKFRVSDDLETAEESDPNAAVKRHHRELVAVQAGAHGC